MKRGKASVFFVAWLWSASIYSALASAQTPTVDAPQGPASEPQLAPATDARAMDNAAGEAAAQPPAPESPAPADPASPKIAESPKIDYSKYLSNDAVGYAALAVEKATIQKSLADEHYLREDWQRAEESYRATLATLDQEAPDEKLTDTQRSVKKLLHVDVDYRLLNLRLGNDFWAGYRTNRPSTPHKHLLVLESLLEQLEKQANEIDVFLTKADLDAAEMTRVQGMRTELEGKIKDQTLGQEKAVIEARQQRMQLGTWDERAKNLIGQRLAVEARSRQLADEQKQLSATASSLLVQAVAAGTGIPPAATTAVMTGNVKAALLQEAAAQLGDANSPISKAISDVSSNAQKLQDLYVTASKNYDTLKQSGDTLKQAADIIRKPTFEGLASAGSTLWSKLPATERQKLTNRVMDSVPVAGLLESYRRLELNTQDAAVLRRRIEILALQRIPMPSIRADVLTMAKQVVKNDEQARAQFRAVYKSISEINLTDEQFKIYVEHFVPVGASDIFAMIPANQRQSVAQLMGEPTVVSAIEKLASKGLSSLPQGHISDDQIVIKGAGKRVEIKIKTLFENATLEQATNGLKGLPALYEEMTKTQALYRLALKQLPSDMLGVAVETALRKENDEYQRQQVMKDLESGMSGDSNKKAKQMLLNQALGSAVVQELVKRKEAAPRLAVPATYPSPGGGTTTGLSQEATAAATAALNYAIPGAGLALSMAQSFAQMSANTAEMNRLADQSLRIMAEQEQLYDLATEAYFQYAIANIEQHRAEVLRDSAERQLGVYSAELNRRINSAQRNLAALGVRRALTYYVSERLREEFDLFDRSFAMWNSGLASRGAISAEIQLDPRNTRYALDSDIHLFDWLNRERESTRGDPDTLRVHWRQMLTLARQVCINRGCKPGDGSLGQIAATGQISAKNQLVTATEWKRFKDWQKNPSGRFMMHFSILPGYRIVPLQYENIRIIDLRLAGQIGATTSILSQIALRHSGISQIPRADKSGAGGVVFQREALLPKQSALFNRPHDFDVNELRNRYNADFSVVNYPILRDFEGYGLYALYQLTLENNVENRSLDDILMNIAYFYNDMSNIVSEEQYLKSIRVADATLPFEIYDYQITSKTSPNCAGRPGNAAYAVETRVTTIPNEMQTSFSAVFSRRANPQTPADLGFLSVADKARLQNLQSCMETRVEAVCKPMDEIKRIAASWAAAHNMAPAGRRDDEFNLLQLTDDSKVPQMYRDRYTTLCRKG